MLASKVDKKFNLGIIHEEQIINKLVKLFDNTNDAPKEAFISTRIRIYQERNFNFEVSTKIFLYINDYPFGLIEKVHFIDKKSNTWKHYYTVRIRLIGIKYAKSLEESLDFLNKKYKIEINPNFKDEFISYKLLEELKND